MLVCCKDEMGTDDQAGLDRGWKWIGHQTSNRNGGGMERMAWSVGGDNGMCERNGIRRRQRNGN